MGQSKQASQLHEKTPKKLSHPAAKLTFLEHVYELRTRLFWVVLPLVVASAAGFQYKDQLINLVMAPLHGQKLIYLTPGGGFSFIFTVSIYFGALLCIPVAVYHLFRFMEPLLGGTSRKVVAAFIFVSAVLAATGAAFGYFVTVPAAINFLATFAGTTVVPSLTAESYLNFVVTYIFGLAALFQIPLLLFIFDYIRPLPPKALLSAQRYVIIGATVLAAIITPTPDALNMAIVAVPVVAVYEIGALAVFIRHRLTDKHRADWRASLQADERLSAIVEELQNAPRENKQPSSRQAEPAPAVSAPQPARVARRNTVDGMIMRHSAPAPAKPPVPAPAQPLRIFQQRAMTARPARSIDGFTFAAS